MFFKKTNTHQEVVFYANCKTSPLSYFHPGQPVSQELGLSSVKFNCERVDLIHVLEYWSGHDPLLLKRILESLANEENFN